MLKIREFLRRYKAVISLGFALALYCTISYLLHIPCPILWFTGISCPGCGITRALISVCKLDFVKAVYYNPSIFVVLVATPLLIISGIKGAKKTGKVILYTTALLMLLVYLYRMVVLHAPILSCDLRNGAIPRLWRWIQSIL